MRIDLRRPLVLATTLALALFAAELASGAPPQRCTSAAGHLSVQSVSPGLSRGVMTGAIRGDYEVAIVASFPASGAGRFFVSGRSTVDTGMGVLSFAEDAAIDTTWQGDVNVATLMTITGANGRWQGTTGHLVLTGFFHRDTGTGELSYRGEICRP